MLNVSVRTLQAFLTLAECCHFTLAAQRSHMSQSSLSQIISKLESYVGARLFERTARGVALTPEGSMLVPTARRVIRDMESSLSDIRDHAKGKLGNVAFAALPSFSDRWMPRAIADFRGRFPLVKVRLYDVSSDKGLELVRSDSVDFSLTARIVQSDEFERVLLYEETFFVICQSNHPLAKRKNAALKSILPFEYLHSDRTGSIWPHVQRTLDGSDVKDSGLEVFHLGTLAGLIANGLGVSVVPETSLETFTQRGLVGVRLTDPGLTRSVHAVKRHGKVLSVSAQSLLEAIGKARPGSQPGPVSN